MFSHGFRLSCVLCLMLSPALMPMGQAQDWVKQMFSEGEHNFGTVPRGAKAEYSFELTNKFQEDVHIASVRSSCGCTIPRIAKADLKTYQTGEIICEFNTSAFIGQKSAVVTVVFTKPYYGEMQLNVSGNIRSDIVAEPGVIEFGDVQLGEEKIADVEVSYAGTNAWEINDVRSENSNLGVRLQRSGANGRVSYKLNVRLKDSAPAGEFNDQIVLVTNDQQYNLVTIPVRGRIQPPLVMSSSVELGSLRVGEEKQDRMIIKSNEEFEIKSIDCEDERFSFTTPEGKKKVHLIPFTFSSDSSGAFRQKVVVSTSLESDNQASTTVSGNVIE